MAYEPRLIAPFRNTGLSKYFKPWIIGSEAFPSINNAYAWRGNVRKREGYRFLAAFPGGDKPVMGLKNYIAPATLAENLIGFSETKSYFFNNVSSTFVDMTFYASPAGTAFSFSGGADDFFWSSNYANSLWVTNNLTADHVKFWNGTPGALGVNGGWSTHQPTVNGITTMDSAIIIMPYKGYMVALNTVEGGNLFQSRARWSQLGTPYTSNVPATAIQNVTPSVSPTVIQSNGHGLVTGQTAGITLIIGTVGNLLNFNQYVVTVIDANNFSIPVDTSGLIYVSGGTVQGPGTTVPPPPFVVDIFGWRDDIPGRGGFVDADTSERIVSAAIVKDTLIVGFQRSTWRLRFTGNEVLPFIWERLNTQYGAESTFSCVSFDEAVLFFSRFGWIASDTNNVARIDENIPDDSFNIESSNTTFVGLRRVQGIRDFYRQIAYWTYQTQGSTSANEIYSYNYLDKSWAIFTPTIPIKTFGYYRTLLDITWQVLNATGPSPPADTWENYNSPDDTWENQGPGENDNFPYIVGGDANGNVYQMFEFFQTPGTDNGTNYGFEITTKSFNPYIDQGRKCRLGYVDLYCTQNPGGEITVYHYIDDNFAQPVAIKTVELFSRGIIPIDNIATGAVTTITTTVNHGLTTGEYATLSSIVGTINQVLNAQSYLVTVIDNTNFTIAVDSTGLTYVQEGYVWNAELPQGTAKYTRIYLGAIAHFHQLVFTVTDAQVADDVKGPAQFEMQGLVLWTRPEGRIRG